MVDKPLHNITVCDFGLHGAGSACGKVLADWGAMVIKVEPLWGCASRGAGEMLGLSIDPGENIHYEMLNGGKQSIAVDLKTTEGLEILYKIIEKSNIFFSNYRMKALKKYGLDYETLSQKFPSLIWGHISGYGTQGPLAKEPGFDIASYWSYGGLVLDPSHTKEGPGYSPFGGGDVMTGYVLASSMAACLYQQQVYGKGQSVYTSLYGVGCWQNSCVIQADYVHPNAVQKERPALGAYYCSKDGEWFTTAIMDYKKQGVVWAKMIQRKDLEKEFQSYETVMEKNAEYTKIIANFFKNYNYAEIHNILEENDIVHCLVQRSGDIVNDAQARENGYAYLIAARNGRQIPMISTPVKFGHQEAIPCEYAPMIGEHTTNILQQLGYGKEDIGGMFRQGIVREEVYKERQEEKV